MSDCILHLQDALGNEKIKWVDPGNLHITLRFLGDTSPPNVKSTIKILEETVPGFSSPEVIFKGLGLFRNIRDPRVIWIGMDTGPILQELKNSLDQKLIPLGYPPEERKFRPHLTLGRFKYIRDHPHKKVQDILENLLTEYRNMQFQKNRIDEVIYYESILRQQGPAYLPLKRIGFQ